MTIKLKLEGYVEVPATGWTVVVQKTGKTAATISLTSANNNYFSDFKLALQTAIRAFSGATYELNQVTIATNADGLTYCYAGTGETIYMTLPQGLLDLFGYNASPVIFYSTTGLVADKMSNSLLSLTSRAISDVQYIDVIKNSTETDTNVYTQYFAEKRSREIEIRFGGWDREVSANEYQAVSNFWRNIILKGQKFKYFPDITISTSAYVENSADSFGYQIYRSTDKQFKPASFANSNYYWTIKLIAKEITT